MSNAYKIINLSGKTKEVYNKIGPFAMDRKVIREMDGYPILADDDMAWFVALDGNKTIGFSAVRNQNDFSEFTYFYVIPEYRGKGVFQIMFDECMKFSKKSGIKLIKADCTDMSLEVFKKAKFKVVKQFQKWTKVEKEL